MEDSKIKEPSDHFAVIWQLKIEANERMKPIRIPSKTTAEEISITLINDKAITDAENFIHHLGHMIKKKRNDKNHQDSLKKIK